MSISRLILTLLAIAALLLVPSVGSADTFYFGVPSGTWGDPDNWLEPGGPPGLGDWAIIDTGQTCRIEAPQAAWVVWLKGTGTAKLIIKGETLSMLKNGSASPAMILNGTVKFEKP